MLSNIVCKYSELFLKTVDRDKIRLFIESDPSYPSLLSVIKVLKYSGISVSAIRCEWENLSFESPFLLHLNVEEKETLIIAHKEQNDTKGLYIYNPVSDKWEWKHRNDILNAWNKIVIYTDKLMPKKHINSVKLFTYLFEVVFSLIMLIYNMLSLPILIGCLISGYIFFKKENSVNNFIHKICSFAKYIDCEVVEESRYSKIWNIDLKEISFAYFLSQISLLFISMILKIEGSIVTLYAISVFILLPCIIYSLYSQVKIKRFCPLCIGVLLIIMLQSIVCCVKYQNEKIDFSIILLYGIIFGIILFFLKYRDCLLEQNKILFERSLQFLKIKRKKSIYQIENREITLKNETVWFGNEESINVITTVISPSCRYCHNMIKELIEMLDMDYNFRWNIVLGEVHPTDSFIIKEWITSYLKNKEIFLNKLKFHLKIENKESNNCKVFHDLDRVNDIITGFQNFISSLKIRHYPKIIINNRMLSECYESSDIKYIISDLK